MGFRSVTFKLPTGYSDEQLKHMISKALRVKKFTFQIEHKSLDARSKPRVTWEIRVGVSSSEIKDGEEKKPQKLEIPNKKSNLPVVVAGSGPAGFFAAFVLQKAGYKVTLVERGSDVRKRGKAILNFETAGKFSPQNNYAFGEGGAGTFSDGKLTSRSKHISKEKQFILENYIKAGAPEEIAYMAHPHLGTDNLKRIVQNLRFQFEDFGGTILFETMLEDINLKNSKITGVTTSQGQIPVHAVVIATGHSAYDTYRMLMRRGVQFRTKNFAIGSRMEHSQEIINLAQWGNASLPGVKAAEYRITSPADGKHQVFSFCMCPGGIVVPASAYAETLVVNGMSYFSRNGKFANAACVAGVHPDELAGKTVSPLEALEWLENLEASFFNYTGSYSAPSCSILEFLNRKNTGSVLHSSYLPGLTSAPLWELLPANIALAMHDGLIDFNQKMKGFETGNLIGLESKTSSPVQVIREENGLCAGFDNLYLAGEGSGYSGGIISSAADGIKAALHLISGQ